MAIQVSALKTAYGEMKQDISDVDNPLFITWADYINKFLYRKLSARDPERFITEQTISVTSGTSTYALPAGFRDIQAYGCGFYLTNSDGTPTDKKLPRTGYGSQTRGYYIKGTNVVFTPTPASSETIINRYLPKVTTIDAIDEYFTTDTTSSGTEVIPEEYLWELIQIVDVWYSIWDEDSTLESLADQRFVRSLDELFNTIRKEPDAYMFPDTSTMF